MPQLLTVDDYAERTEASQLPQTDTGVRDDVRIQRAIDDAIGEIGGEMGMDLEGAVSLTPRLTASLKDIAHALTKIRLADGAVGAEDPVAMEAKAARQRLRRLSPEPTNPEIGARIVTGTSQWGRRPGIAPERTSVRR